MWNSLSTLSTISSISTFAYFVLLIACLLGFMLTPAVVYARLNFKKRKNAHVYPNGLIFTLIPLVFTLISRENMLKIVASKVAKVPGVVQLRSFGEKPLKGINLSNEHSFVLFRGCRYIYIYIYRYVFWYLMIYIYTYVYDTREFIYTYLYCMTEPTRRKKCKTSPLHIPESQLLFFVL